MLSVAKVGRGREAYYVQRVAFSSDGASGLVEPPGTWTGRVADDLGVAGSVVELEAISSAMSGAHPRTKETLDEGHRRVRVAGFDCTFAPPKSVSLLYALGSPEVGGEVGASHERAVSEVLRYLERQAARVRHQRAGERDLLEATGFLVAAFVHRSSRAADPHLHTHAVVTNLASDASGRWSAIDSRALYRHLASANLLYSSQLRHELTERLGVRFAGASPFSDLAGLDRHVVEAFSTRQRDIENELEASGQSGSRAARVAADRTRPPKDLSHPYEELVTSWRERAYRLGCSDRHIAQLCHSTGRLVRPSAPPGPDGRSCALAGLAELSGRRATFSRRDLVAASCSSLARGVPVDSIEAQVDAVLASSEVVVLLEADGSPSPLHSEGGSSGRSAEVFPEAGSAGRFDRDMREQRYSTARWLDAQARRDAAVERFSRSTARAGAAGTYPIGMDSQAGVAHRPEHGSVIAAIAAEVAAGTEVVAVTSGSRRAAHLEAVLGIEARAIGRAPRAGSDSSRIEARSRWSSPTDDVLAGLRADAHVLVEASKMLAPFVLEGLLDRSRPGKPRVDFVAPGSFDSALLEAARSQVAQVDGAMRAARADQVLERSTAQRSLVGRVEVAVVGSTGQLLVAVRESWEQAIASGKDARVVVSGEEVGEVVRRFLGETASGVLGHPGHMVVTVGRLGRDAPLSSRGRAGASTADQTNETGSTSGPGPVSWIVIGRAEMLGRFLDRVDDGARLHVLVDPGGLALEDRAGWLAEVALARHLRTELGMPPPAPSARRDWRAAAGLVESFRARWGVADLESAFGGCERSASPAPGSRNAVTGHEQVLRTIGPTKAMLNDLEMAQLAKANLQRAAHRRRSGPELSR